MKHEGNIWAGTFGEFREFIIDRIYEDCQNEKHSDFKNYNFAFCYTLNDLTHTVKELYDDAEGWFGIKYLDAGFESSGWRQFVSDYYGGGQFGVCSIFLLDFNRDFSDFDRDYVAREVIKMITMTFGYGHSSEICVWEEEK